MVSTLFHVTLLTSGLLRKNFFTSGACHPFAMEQSTLSPWMLYREAS